MSRNDEADSSLRDELDAVRAELVQLNGHRFIRLHNSYLRMGLFQLYRGLAFGFGSVLGATILVSVAAYILRNIDFIPIIGDWAAEIAREIQTGTTTDPAPDPAPEPAPE